MNRLFTLTKLETGKSARVIKLLAKGSIRRRLQDIGVIEGTDIECIMKSPWNDPIAYKIRGAVIAIRNEDSENIIVSNKYSK